MWVPVAIGLGSNVGESFEHLQEAERRIRSHVANPQMSSIYRTAPMYVEDQPDFLNAVLIAETELGPAELLRMLKRIESEMGRDQNGVRRGPRIIDLDLLLYGRLAYNFEFADGKKLAIPHPHMSERAFVMVPLLELLGAVFVPGLGRFDTNLPTILEGQSVCKVEWPSSVST